MKNTKGGYAEVPGLYKIIPLKPFRKTSGVTFDIVPPGILPQIDAIDRVIHENGAISPGSAENVERPWYMHPFQEDHLLVAHGTRYTDLYTTTHGKIESFEISAQRILKNGEIFFNGPAILAWPCSVFHRIRSDEKNGSVSLNFAVRHTGFDINTNFNTYDVDVKKGEHRLIREGHLDQF